MHANQSNKTPGSPDTSDKTDMGRVKKIAGGAVDEGKDSKPKMPTAELDKHCK